MPYINGVKHLGILVGSMLPADVYARFLRQRGDEVLFVCATDEHGTPAELAAAEAGLDVAAYCRQQHDVQARLGERFGLSFDVFGRSSSPQNRELTQRFGRRLDEMGLIEERLTRQMYSLDDDRFLPDRYIVGTCPHCGYERARVDQCESCTRLLDPTELIEPRSAVSGSTKLEVRDSRHLFLLRSRLSAELFAKHDCPRVRRRRELSLVLEARSTSGGVARSVRRAAVLPMQARHPTSGMALRRFFRGRRPSRRSLDRTERQSRG